MCGLPRTVAMLFLDFMKFVHSFGIGLSCFHGRRFLQDFVVVHWLPFLAHHHIKPQMERSDGFRSVMRTSIMLSVGKAKGSFESTSRVKPGDPLAPVLLLFAMQIAPVWVVSCTEWWIRTANPHRIHHQAQWEIGSEYVRHEHHPNNNSIRIISS